MYVQYSYDTNQKIHVQARQEGDTADLPIREEPFLEEDYQKFLRPYEEEQTLPLTAVLAIDVSGSMYGRPMELAKRHAVESFVDMLAGNGVRIGVMEFSDQVRWTLRPSGDFRRVRRAVECVTAGATGGGNSTDPFREIDRELSGLPDRRFAVILTDGVWACQNAAIQRAKTCHAHGIDVAGIGFGCADKAFLEAISSQQGLSAMTDLAHLGEAFGSIAQQIGGRGAREEGGGWLGRFGRGRKAEERPLRSAWTWELNDTD